MAKKKLKTRIPVAGPVDPMGPTPERMGQYGERGDRFQTDTGRIIERLSPVDRLYSEDAIGPEGYISAGHYLSDWVSSGFAQSGVVDMSVDRVDGGGNSDAFNAKRMDAAKRFAAANGYLRVIDPGYITALHHMVLGDLSPTAYARDILKRSPKSNTLADVGARVLAKALNCLAGFYAPSTAPAKPRTRSSMAADARPTIHPFQKDEAA